MAFFTIFVPDGLSDGDYERALRAGPSEVSSRRRNHVEMLTAAGFGAIEETDFTGEFLETTRAWLRERDTHAGELISAEGEERFRERRKDSLAQLAAIEAGLLRRSLFVCR